MKISTLLNDSETEALHFSPESLRSLDVALPNAELSHHSSEQSFLEDSAQTDIVVTWRFRELWYPHFPRLKRIYTPAAGHDWIESDPLDRVPIIYGTFHGSILAESLLGALLFMNRRMPAMIKNHRERKWDRNLQSRTKLIKDQTVLILGYGNIARFCKSALEPLVKQIIGVRQKADGDGVFRNTELPTLLPNADHVVLLLPGTTSNDRFMNDERLSLMKPGSYIYNFGRGNALLAQDLLPAMKHLGGAFLDVTEEEPLPTKSALWSHENIFITPHSSCMCDNYRDLYISELIDHLAR
ncbi:MAG: NAD(P)-dependent oxidoreductase [Candidatus Azotimanducaceae bacterium]|uniref:D-isomer specific 2-hydroxyacid dehydrogenase NAD-binding domain-containing protein n=1 Tax=OM182 bacterium TaxID=2510334 RepID=A0A520RYM2_9GAMM|nr:hypothetical protein [Gammaproteobacteria bacterium]RZO75285.1 MAG: hypothetical protein EVA68_07350 [OM182 bacterium]